MDYQRYEKDGKVVYVRGEERIAVPSLAACRERLVKLLEDAGGDITQQSVKDFWVAQAGEFFDPDEMKCAWAQEKYERLSKAWEELTTPPAPPQEEPDLLAEFDL